MNRLLETLERRTLFATLPAGFFDALVMDGLDQPVSLDVAPDGRIFVTEQKGTVRVIKNGELLPAPAVTLDVSSSGERGALGITLDPNFSDNGYIYIFHTAKEPSIHNRVSRFTIAGDLAAPGSEQVIFDLDPLGSGALVHNGGSVHFTPDGKLLISTGENGSASQAQSLSNTHGKILRVNADGSIPEDNPFYNTATGNNRAIWAYGLRNAYTFAVDQRDGRVFINDVGAASWEEINVGAPGANFGWPGSEGDTENVGVTPPLFAYPHSSNDPNGVKGCSITGGTFYDVLDGNFPEEYRDDYFFCDGCTPSIWRLDSQTNTASLFAGEIGPSVNLVTGPDGSIYYVGYTAGEIHKISFADENTAPLITPQPATQQVQAGQTATFTVEAAGQAPLSYQWTKNGENIPGATSPTLTLDSVTNDDAGAIIRVVVSNDLGSITSTHAVLNVIVDQPPVPVIKSPVAGKLYRAGQMLKFSGAASDPEDGKLRPSALSWRIDFHHDTHSHPFYPETAGKKGGSVRIPRVGETADNVWYRIHLTATDSLGVTGTTTLDVHPQKATVTIDALPPGLTVNLDGSPMTTPFNFTGVVGITRELSVTSDQILEGQNFTFSGWKPGGKKTLIAVNTPAKDRTYVARFKAAE